MPWILTSKETLKDLNKENKYFVFLIQDRNNYEPLKSIFQSTLVLFLLKKPQPKSLVNVITNDKVV